MLISRAVRLVPTYQCTLSLRLGPDRDVTISHVPSGRVQVLSITDAVAMREEVFLTFLQALKNASEIPQLEMPKERTPRKRKQKEANT